MNKSLKNIKVRNEKNNFFFWLLTFVLFTGLVITYSNHFNNPFHFDDVHTIENNVWIRSLSNIPRFYVDGTTTSSLPSNQGYRPGITTLNAIDYWMATKDFFKVGANPLHPNESGLKPFYFHLSIFISFIFQLVLMFLFFKKIFDKSLSNEWNKFIALFAVALYGFHTANAETINYIIARSDSFSTLMILLSFVIYIYFPQKRKYQFFLLPYIFGSLVKETALMFAPLLFVYVILFEMQVDFTRIFRKENLKKAGTSLLIVSPALAFGVILFIINSLLTPKSVLRAIISPFNYLITQPFVMVQYFKNFFLPTELSADTDWQVLETTFANNYLLGLCYLIMGLMFITGMIWLAIRLSRKEIYRPVSFGIFWFFIALLPTSSIFPLSEVLNDHRMFFPFVGLTVSFIWALAQIIVFRNITSVKLPAKKKFIFIVLMFALIIPHAYGVHQRNKVWSSYESLWYDVTKKSPYNGRGLMNYALSKMRKGEYSEAKKYFNKALKLIPNYSLLHINLGVLYSALGDRYNADKFYKNAIALGTYADQACYYYGDYLLNCKRYEEAKMYLQRAISINPAYAEPRYSLLNLYFFTEDWDNLKRLAEETLQMIPGDAKCLAYIDAAKNKKSKLDVALETANTNPTPENYLNLSLFYYEAGMYNECIDACEKAIKLKPDYASAYNNICSSYNALKMYDKAIEACNKAISLEPNFELAKNNLKFAQSQKK